ncbi:MAG: HAD family hydrolase [Myxococcota bacterium]
MLTFLATMDLIAFDLDGTLLNASGVISPFTRETLTKLSERGILYTIATGRTLHASLEVLKSHAFRHPQAYKNGVVIWDPTAEDYTHHNFLTHSEIQHVLEAVLRQGMTPFMFTVEPGQRHAVYHPPLRTEIELLLAKDFKERSGLPVLPASELPAEADITNVSALGAPHAIDAVYAFIADEPDLIAYSTNALEDSTYKWIDIHHIDASKGNAVQVLKQELGATRVLCFGDSMNDVSMFEIADESYAPANAKRPLREAATAVIGHHDEDGIAHFLRERFSL